MNVHTYRNSSWHRLGLVSGTQLHQDVINFDPLYAQIYSAHSRSKTTYLVLLNTQISPLELALIAGCEHD